MARLRQYFANRYASAEATNSEFENIIRYLNAAEIGNLTLGELMSKIFDAGGEVKLGIDFRFDPAFGIQFKIDEDSENWTTLVGAEEIRGPSGANVGNVETPLFTNRQDIVATAGQTDFPYIITSGAATVIVWVNGVLMAESSYTYSQPTGLLIFGSGRALNDVVTIASIRTTPSTAYRRSDQTAAAGQVTFPFAHTETEEIIVFRNGIFQRAGGGFDYVASPQSGVITMTTSQSSGTVITIICITNSLIREVNGLMLEDRYATNGFIRLDRIAIADGAIPKAKVDGLVAELANKAQITVSGTSPASPGLGDFWVNTSTSVPSLLFWDGVRWLSASPNGLVPLPQTADALRFLRLNSTASALEYAPIDFSGLLRTEQLGLGGGVAPLNPQAKVPRLNLPNFAFRCPITGSLPGAIANATRVVAIISNAKHTFQGLSARLGAGSCTLQLQVNGVNVGSTLSVNTTTARLAISDVVEDATATPRNVALVITAATSASDLTFNVETLIDD